MLPLLTFKRPSTLVADSHNELQAQFDIIGHYSRQERYKINPTETVTTVSVYPSKRSITPGTQQVEVCDEEVTPIEHLIYPSWHQSLCGKTIP